jgi:hypothetical protein
LRDPGLQRGQQDFQSVEEEVAGMQKHSETWHSRMTAFVRHCRASAAGEQADRLREAMSIRRIQPDNSGSVATAPDDLNFDRLLAQSAFECAALEVLGPRAEFELSCGEIRDLSARVRLPGQTQFSSGEGRTIALALLAAWASAHLAETSRVLMAAEAGNREAK